jgi:hypothetical protein
VFLALCLCEQGHLMLARGGDGRPLLERARGTSAAARAGSESEPVRRIDQLSRAVRDQGAGKRLFRGQCPSDVPAGLLQRLVLASGTGGTR